MPTARCRAEGFAAAGAAHGAAHGEQTDGGRRCGATRWDATHRRCPGRRGLGSLTLDDTMYIVRSDILAMRCGEVRCDVLRRNIRMLRRGRCTTR